MFFPIRFKTHIQLPPKDLNGNFDEIIEKKMKGKLEGLCSRFGYIKPGSLEVVRRSAGMFMKQHFNGHIRFDIYCKGDVCNPPQGMVVEAVVKNKNALGLLAESSMSLGDHTIPVLDIIVPRKAAGIASEINLDDVEIGDNIFVMVMGKRYQLNDTNISIIGRAMKQLHQTVEQIIDSEEGDDPANEDSTYPYIEDENGEDDEYQSDDETNDIKTMSVHHVAEEFGDEVDDIEDDEFDEDFEEGGDDESYGGGDEYD